MLLLGLNPFNKVLSPRVSLRFCCQNTDLILVLLSLAKMLRKYLLMNELHPFPAIYETDVSFLIGLSTNQRETSV